MKENQKKLLNLHKAATKEQYFFSILRNEMLISRISSLKHKKIHYKSEIHVIHNYMKINVNKGKIKCDTYS